MERDENGGIYGIGICYSGSSGADGYMVIHAMRFDMVCCKIEQRELEAGVWSTDLQLRAMMPSLGKHIIQYGNKHRSAKSRHFERSATLCNEILCIKV